MVSLESAAAGQLARVDRARLLSRIAALRRIGATQSGGVTRLAFTPEYRAGRELTAGYLAAAGTSPAIDPAGNLIAVLPGRDPHRPALVLGSHLDTVPEGGHLDGGYGVLAAVEVVQRLVELEVRLDHPVAVVAFNDEEGAFGTPGMLGSHAFAGSLGAHVPAGHDDRGRLVADLIAAADGDASRLPEAAWSAGQIAGYLELHVEQGPVLERLGRVVGVVTTITGRTSLDVVVRGEANHAGTTPMEFRRDALVAASRMVLAVRELADRGAVRVATVGSCSVQPNAWNVVPGLVRLRVDLRDVSGEALERAAGELARKVGEIAGACGVVVDVAPVQPVAPVPCDPRLQRLIIDAAERLGHAPHLLPSGAGHDAQVVAALAPIGMIFVPSRAGVSHSPAEHTDPDQLAAGADVLLQTVLDFDREWT
jgi:hydantoinase/carbamoylase family amidase